MKKYITYSAILILGLVLGWLVFSKSSSKDQKHDHNSVSQTNQMWTCSMHPQIMKAEAGDCPICGMDLIPAESNSEGLLADQFQLTENAMALANIQTSMVGKGMADTNGIQLSGKIAENEKNNEVQVSYFAGRIERLNVNSTGESINKGQLLATVYSPQLYAAQQELITAASLKETQPALYRAVRNKLKLWKLSDSQINQIETSGKVRENFPVYATVSGTVTEKMVNQGDYVNQGQPLLKIANLNTVWANFDVYENQIDQFKTGQDVIVTTNAYPNKEFKGTVNFIDPILNTQTRTVTLRVILNNKDDLFKPGMFVKGNIEGSLATNDKVITIPASAVMWTGERSVVYLKTEPNRPVFEMRDVVLGNQIGTDYEILEGLADSDEIVTNGTFTVDAAAQLGGKKSMMNQKERQVLDATNGTQPSMKLNLPQEFQKEFQILLEPYLKLKDAFVASDANKVATISKAMFKTIQSIKTNGLEQMELSHFNELKDMLQMISEEKNIEKQRAHFVTFNENIVAVISHLDILEKELYVQKCPMANNNKGAVWLSDKKEIRNPYYGEAMLTCGEVKQTLK
ncbi:efflux RND transporter periplasmic adaptor subunit [Psychroserpens sp.]|uniref:efflux RND transporter periplasmic adaptor subunit n=1 Tax=Psychroserpens sp. TaxID=2020870 RepID=UPI003C7239F4